MADNQEQFSYEEYKTYKRVAKMMAEDGGDNKQSLQINDDPAGNPNEPHNEYHRKAQAHLHRKMNYTAEEKAFAKQIVKNIRY